MSDEAADWLQRQIFDRHFLARYPYYAFVLSGMTAVVDPAVPVMAVSAWHNRFWLHVNVDFFRPQPRYVAGTLLHEVHHVVLGHLTEPKFRGPSHPDLLEIAMEVSANEFIAEPLPGAPATCRDYARFGLGPGQSTIERYELLRQARRRGKGVPVCVPVDSHLAGGLLSAPGAGRLDPAAFPCEVRRLIEGALAKAEQMAAAAGTALPGGLLAGREPGQLLEELAATDIEPESQREWKAALQMFVGLIRTPVHTYARPNRRFPDKIGQVPGRIWFPGQVETPSLLVAIDTSGSMTAEELVEIARQLIPLSSLVRMTVVECDAKIQRVYPFAGRLDRVAGRGGTDLRPVFARQFLDEHRPDGVIYFTDGLGPYPERDPGIKTLWILSKPDPFNCPWGEKAWLCRFQENPSVDGPSD